MADNDKKKSTKKVEKREDKNKKFTKVVDSVPVDVEKSTEKVDKKESSEVISPIIVEKESTISNKNASFVQRLGAYLIDMFLILLISSIVTMPFTSSNNYEKLSEETNKVVEEYTNGKIDMNTYMNRVSSISYDMARETGLSSIIMIAVYVLYFIVYQYYKKGQTVGKKLMKIRIESTDSGELFINAMLMRSFIINSILVNMIVLTVSIVGNRYVYTTTVTVFQLIQYMVLFITALMVLSRKDKRGLHDIICHTKVVNVEV